MARQISKDILRHLQRIIESDPVGLKGRDIRRIYETETGQQVSARTVQYWLKRLVESGRIQRGGKGPATEYFPVIAARSGDSANRKQADLNVIVSDAAAVVHSQINQPISQRLPVGYNSAFLENYVPGESWYLSSELRTHLYELGRTPEAARPAGTYARQILDRLLIDLSWASSRLEGNTYSRLDTRNLIEFGQSAEGKDAAETQMVLNHKHAIELLVTRAEEVGFNNYTFRNLHAALSENLLGDPADEGRLRRRAVEITGSTFVPVAIPQQIEEHFEIILRKTAAIPDPFEQSFFILVHIPYLQPFVDANKRLSRIGSNLSLIKTNLCPISFIDLPDDVYLDAVLAVYELNKIDLLLDCFSWAYERSCRRFQVIKESLVEPDTMRMQFRNQLAEIIRYVIRAGLLPSEPIIRSQIPESVPSSDVESFVKLVESEFENLHEGSIVRYHLRLSEYEKWRYEIESNTSD